VIWIAFGAGLLLGAAIVAAMRRAETSDTWSLIVATTHPPTNPKPRAKAAGSGA